MSWVVREDGKRWLIVDATKVNSERAPRSTAAQLSKQMAYRAEPPAAEKTITTQKADRIMPDGMKPVPSEGLSADKLIRPRFQCG